MPREFNLVAPKTATRTPQKDRFGPQFSAASLLTLQECEDAIDELTQIIANIESQLTNREKAQSDPGWYKKTTAALGYKKGSLEDVRRRHSELNGDSTVVYSLRIQEALGYAFDFATVTGEQEKAWVIDQMVRALTADGYQNWVTQYTDEEGLVWDVGIAP